MGKEIKIKKENMNPLLARLQLNGIRNKRREHESDSGKATVKGKK
ncbi:MAG: hypothetical protein N2376_06210 [Clostridia bacterium]|nr:hypothetical protein [Clostridia bacterium]